MGPLMRNPETYRARKPRRLVFGSGICPPSWTVPLLKGEGNELSEGLMGYEDGICDVCRKSLQMIECNANPRSAEGYCAHCHKSYVIPAGALDGGEEEDVVTMRPRRKRR